MSTSAELVAAARARIRNLSVDEVREEVAGGTTVVDLREPAEIEAHGTIPGALRVPRGMLEFQADPASPKHLEGLDPAQPVLLYCSAGSRSALGGASLKDLGYADVAHLEGGFDAWLEAGGETEA